MKLNDSRDIEKGDARWEKVELKNGSETSEIYRLLNFAEGDHMQPFFGRMHAFEELVSGANKAFILRRGGKATGCILYKFGNVADEPSAAEIPTLHIHYMFLSKQERVSGLASAVELLRKEARHNNAQCVTWRDMTDVSKGITAKLKPAAPRMLDGEAFIDLNMLPIDQFSVHTLLSKMRSG